MRSASPVSRLNVSLLLVSYGLVAASAFWWRIADLGGFLNIDEVMFWLQRSEQFWSALMRGDWAATAISTHPGVTTMWLGGLGLRLQHIAFDLGWTGDGSYATFLMWVRLPMMLVHSAAVVLGYAMLRRMWPPLWAFFAAMFWACDPFVVGYSRMLHVDGLAGTFLTLSLLSACLAWHYRREYRWVVLSAVCAGLAMLSKLPALAILPSVGVLCLLACMPFSALYRDPLPWWRWFLRSGALWCAVALITVVALWPALWTGLSAAFGQVQLGVQAEGAGTHVSGNYFLGYEMDSPGLLFYPAALALRLMPLSMIGLFAVPIALRLATPEQRRDLAVLTGFVLFFVVAMSVFSNKLNRYLVPAFPAVDLLAGAGFGALIVWIGRKIPQPSYQGLWLAGATAVAGFMVFNTMSGWHPYGVAAFNPLLGGAQAGARTFYYGTGEGLEQVAEWINEQPDSTGVITISPMVQALQPYTARGVQASNPSDGQLPDKAGYVVVYGRLLQRADAGAPFNQFYPRRTPLKHIQIHGVDYAFIYQAPPQVDVVANAQFGDTLELHGFDITSPAQSGGALVLRLNWYIDQRARDVMLFAHVLGADGQRYAQVDLPLAASWWQAGRYEPSELPIALPADLPAGEYTVALGLYDPNSGERLDLRAGTALPDELAGPHALDLYHFSIP